MPICTRLSGADITQELLEGQSPVMTAEMRTHFNAVYGTTIDICSIGKIIFRNNAGRRAMFQFSSVAAHQTTAGKKTKAKA